MKKLAQSLVAVLVVVLLLIGGLSMPFGLDIPAATPTMTPTRTPTCTSEASPMPFSINGMTPISDDSGSKVFGWMEAQRSVSICSNSNGTLYYWEYSEQRWVEIPVVNGQMQLPIGWVLVSDPSFSFPGDPDPNRLMVETEADKLVYFWVEIKPNGQEISATQVQRLLFVENKKK